MDNILIQKGKFANGAITGTYTVMFNDMMHEGDPRTEGTFKSSKADMIDYLISMAERDNVEVAGYVLLNKTTGSEEYFVQPWYGNEIDNAINGWDEINPKTGKSWLPNWEDYSQIEQHHIHIDGSFPSRSDARYSTNLQKPVFVHQKTSNGYVLWQAFQYPAVVPIIPNGIYGKRL